MKYLKENLDYQFLDDIKQYPTTPVKILTGVYKDTTICYGKIRIIEEKENEGILGFTFQIISPKDRILDLNSDSEFKNYLGNILDSIIMDANEMPLGLPDSDVYNNDLLEEAEEFATRKINNKKFDGRSGIWEEGDTISEE